MGFRVPFDSQHSHAVSWFGSVGGRPALDRPTLDPDRCVGLRPNLHRLRSVPGPADPGSSCIGLQPDEVANPCLVFVTADIIEIVGHVALARTPRVR